jgi:prefoldin beta subunit
VCKRCAVSIPHQLTPLIILQEFERLGEGETIYKLVGPVLLKQDKIEADSTVKGRLDFIGGEM